MQLARAHAEERVARRLGPLLVQIDRPPALAATRLPQLDLGRQAQLLPGARAEVVAEAGLVVAAAQAVAAAVLLVRPADGQVRARADLTVDDRPIAERRPDDDAYRARSARRSTRPARREPAPARTQLLRSARAPCGSRPRGIPARRCRSPCSGRGRSRRRRTRRVELHDGVVRAHPVAVVARHAAAAGQAAPCLEQRGPSSSPATTSSNVEARRAASEWGAPCAARRRSTRCSARRRSRPRAVGSGT